MKNSRFMTAVPALQRLTAGVFLAASCAAAHAVISLPSTPPASAPVSSVPVTKYEYDAEGNPTKTIVAPSTRAYATKHEYDALGRRKNTTDAKSGLTQFGYDLQDQLTSVTDPRQLVTQYEPSGLGDVKKLISPDTGTTNNTSFDAAGNLKASTDARGVLASYDYDELNRPTQVVYSKTGATSRTVNWTYDQTGASFGYGVGRLTTAATPDASTTFRYDALGRVKMTVQSGSAGNPLVVNYDYDDAGHVTGLTYPSGRVVTFGWADGQPQSIAITSGTTTKTLLDQIAMSAFGPVKSWVWKFGATATAHIRVYDTSGRLVRQTVGDVTRDITYDDADRISSFKHYLTGPASSYDQTFGYDELDRLTSVAGSTNWSYSYDVNGNRTSAGSRVYTVQATNNKLDSLNNPARNMLYDAAGNTSSDIQTGSSANYTATYSLEGSLAAMAQGSSAGVDFGYDAMGRRITRGLWVGSSSNPRTYTLYAYDQDNHLIGEYNADGTPITEYVWLGDTPVAVIKPDGTGMQIYAIHTDHLDTPRVILDANKKVRWRWMGEPFGASPAEEQPTAGLAALQQNLRFPGQQYEPFGGRHYNHFRDYDPTTGRYVQSDPIGLAGGINTYAYVGGNPLSYVDPLGLFITATYNHATGMLYAYDSDTGKLYSGPFESGGKPWGDPIPNGDFDILSDRRNDFFRLEPVDQSYGDDQTSSGRGEFRLHKPGRTVGCVSSKDAANWKSIRDAIRGSSGDNVNVLSKSRNPFNRNPVESLYRYGRLTVINSPR